MSVNMHIAVRKVPCPWCCAEEGKPCQTTSGKSAYQSHRARINKYWGLRGDR